MAKQPSLTLLTSGYYSQETITANFEAIRDQFDNTVSLDGSTPNTMLGDLDMNSYSIINVGDIDVATLTINGIDVTSIINNPLDGLTPTLGDLLYWNGSSWALLPVGTEGQVVKSVGGVPEYGDDIDTDTDTVGITVEEDGVSIQTEVTVLNFVTGLQATTPIVTVDVSNNVTVDLDTFVNG